MNTPRDTIETGAWSDRELLLRIYYQTVETNGSVRQLNRDVYGDSAHGLIGLKELSNINTAYREKLKAAYKLVVGIGALVFAALFSILGILLAAHI